MLTIDLKKKAAHLLYTNGWDADQISTAIALDTQQVSQWVQDNYWRADPKNMIARVTHSVQFLTNQIERLEAAVLSRPEESVMIEKELNVYLKLLNAIRSLKTEHDLSRDAMVLTRLLEFTFERHVEHATPVKRVCDAFLAHKTRNKV